MKDLFKRLSKAFDRRISVAVGTSGTWTSYSDLRRAEGVLAAYGTQPWLRAVVRKIANAVATTSWKVYRVHDVPRNDIVRLVESPYNIRKFITKNTRYIKGELEEIRDHPLAELLRYGNDYMSGFEVLFVTQVHLDLVGEAFWRLGLSSLGTVERIYPIVPTRVSRIPVPSKDRTEATTYEILIDDETGRHSEIVPRDEIVMFREPDPLAPYGRGLGMAQTLGDEMQSDELASWHIRRFFEGGGWPNLLVSIEGATPEECARLENIWNRKFATAANRYKAAFVNRKLGVEQIGHSFRDMELVELRKFNRDLVIQYFGVPPEKFGQLTACFDAETEVLTETGWKKWPDVRTTDKLASFDPDDGRIVFDWPKALHEYDWKGFLDHWTGQAVDLMVTPNHRLLVRKPSVDGKWWFLSSEALSMFSPEPLFAMRIGGWKTKKTVSSRGVKVGSAWYDHRDLAHAFAVYLDDGEIVDPLGDVIEEVGSDIGELARAIVPRLPASALSILVEWFRDSRAKNSFDALGRRWTNIPVRSAEVADVLQWAAVLSGYACNIVTDGNGGTWLHLSDEGEYWFHVGWKNVMYRNSVAYEGKVYCATTKHGTLIVRRNGKVVATGNSNRSTIVMASEFWLEDIIVPRADFIRATIQRELVPRFEDEDETLVVDFDPPIVSDREHTLDVIKTLPGAFTINEVRAQAGLPSLGERGEKHILRPGEVLLTGIGAPPEDGESEGDDQPSDGEKGIIDEREIDLIFGEIEKIRKGLKD